MPRKNKNPTDAKVVAAGFLLILLVSGLFFLKNHYLQKQKQSALLTDKNDSSQEYKNFTGISATDLEKEITDRKNILIFDLRDSDSFDTAHILDSKNVSLDYLQSAVSGKDASLDPDKNYVFVDDLGITPNELQVLQLFRQAGFKNISYLEGGISEWMNESQPTITLGNPYSLIDRSKVTEVTSDKLKKALEVEKVYLVDVRTPAEFAAGHIQGAVNIPLDDLEARRKELPLGERIVLYDNNGVKAFQGGVRLYDAGIIGTFILSDGFKTWQQKNYPIVTGQ